MTRALDALGMFFGHRVSADNHEALFFYFLHERYLRQIGATWYEPRLVLEHLDDERQFRGCCEYFGTETHGALGASWRFWREYAGGRQTLRFLLNSAASWGWKDPRTTLFAASWHELFPSAKFLHIVRHPIDVALSLQRREERWRREGHAPHGRMTELRECVSIVSDYTVAGRRCAAWGDNYLEVRFEDVLADPLESLTKMALFAGLRPTAGQLKAAATQLDSERRGRFLDISPGLLGELLEICPYAHELDYVAADGVHG